MSAIVKNIAPPEFRVIIGAPEALVSMREYRGHYLKKTSQGYHTNRLIKTWAAWFILKGLTRTGVIQNWNNQKAYLLRFLQMTDATFRWHLKEMQRLKLVETHHSSRKPSENDRDIVLCSYQDAAAILGISRCRTKAIPYNPDQYDGNQVFQHFLRSEEIDSRQTIQLEALTYHINKNPSLRNNLQLLLVKAGANEKQLINDPLYFQAQLLQLQMKYFKEGSELFDYVMEHPANINRGAELIKEYHGYKCRQSVSYMKKRLRHFKLVNVEKICVESRQRTRLYVPGDDGKKRDGYKWISRPDHRGGRDNGITAWFLTDQITLRYKTLKSNERKEKKDAA